MSPTSSKVKNNFMHTSVKLVTTHRNVLMLQKFKIRMLPETVVNFFYNTISETIKQREEKNIIRPDMIHLLMEARKGKRFQEDQSVPSTGFATADDQFINKNEKATPQKEHLTLDDIIAQAFVFFVAGFETVSTLLCFSAHELAEKPDLQKKLRDEVDQTIEACHGQLTYEAVAHMKYLDMVVSGTSVCSNTVFNSKESRVT